jgi:outer membrane receptor for Fe3+-dicitrate
MFDDDFKKVTYNYFNSGAIKEIESGTYADKTADIVQEYVVWNHGLSEVIKSLIKNGLELNSLDEFDYSPCNCFSKTKKIGPKKYRITHLDNKIPLVYSIVATKKRV